MENLCLLKETQYASALPRSFILEFTQTHLLNVSIQAEEVEDAGAVHLGWMKATDHGHGAGGVASVRG